MFRNYAPKTAHENHPEGHRNRRAVAVVLVVVTLPVLGGVAALTVDVGYLMLTRQQLQTSADASAMAAAWTLYDANGEVDTVAAQTAASQIATNNASDASHELVFGWIQNPLDPTSPFFATAPETANAFRVLSSRDEATGNAVSLFFANLFGVASSNVSASAVSAFTPVGGTDVVPVALRTPGFGPVDPDVAEANPGKDGPSEPLDGNSFEIGEQVTLFAFGKGKKSPVHLILNTNDIPGEAQLGKILTGEDPPVPISIGDEIDVMGEGTGHNGLGGKLASRLDDADPANDTIIVTIAEIIPGSRNGWGDLDGNIRIIDFIAVHLDAVVDTTVPDPNDPQNKGKTIAIQLLVGTVVRRAVPGRGTGAASGFVNGDSVSIPQLVR